MTHMTRITRNVTFPDEMLLDIFTTALEGGIGYWSVCHTYRWQKDDKPDLMGFHAIVDDIERDTGATGIRIDRDTIIAGLDLLVSKDWSPHNEPAHIERAGRMLIAGISPEGYELLDFDAEDADVIVQLGLFGEVVYG